MKNHYERIKHGTHSAFRCVVRFFMNIFRRVGCFFASKWQVVTLWYDGQAQRYPILRHLWVRVTLVVIAVAIMFSPIYAVITQYVNSQTYKLSTKETALLSQSTVSTKYIKETADAITYNRADEQSTANGAEQAITLAASKADATGKQPYQVELSKDTKKGITFSDGDGARTITMLPQFSTLSPKLSENRVIYPNGSNEKQVYSFKANGIKSDIVLMAAPGADTKTYTWQLKLDKTLEARLNSDGSVGVYSADAMLFDNLQVGDDKTKTLIDKARTNGAKNNLVFELPRPFILDANNQTKYDDVSYSLDGNLLTLSARNLKSQAYPLSIDPTVTVTTTADFAQQTGDTGNVDSSTANEIRRSSANSGAVGATVSQAAIFATARSQHSSVVYNNYLYIIGGHDGTNYVSDVRYCSFGANGAISTCTATTALGTARRGHTSVVANGYLYVVGGYHATSDTACNGAASNYCSDVRYALVCTGSNSGVGGCGATAGTIGTWNASTSLAVAREGHSSVVYNGFLYVSGGVHATSDTACNGAASTYCSDNLYAPLNADGTIGSWSATTSFTTARTRHASVVYNGFLYIIGGWNGTTYYNDVQYCALSSTGTITSCTSQASAFATTRYGHTSVVYNGYIYIIGGTSGSYQNDIQYCSINTNGSIGSCTQHAGAFTTARSGHTSIAYDGYVYVIGGTNGTNQNDIQHLQISPVLPQAIQQTGVFADPRNRFGLAAFDGYIYLLAGWKDTGTPKDLDTVIKCVINTDATIGACSDAGDTLTRGTYGVSVTMYHNIIYMSGGKVDADDNVVPDVTRCVVNVNPSDGITDHNVVCDRQIKIINSGNTDPYLLGSAAYNGYLYLVGGHTDATSGYLNTIYRCAISDPNGSVGNCTSAGSTLTVARDRLSVVIYKGYLYAIGGANGSGFRNDIESCPINTNGTVGTCTVKTTFTNARGEHTSAVYGDKLYIMGGWNGTTYYNDIITCTLGSSGAASGCTQQTNAFTTARYGHASAFYNGYVYILGGKSSGSYLNDAQYMQLGPSHGGVGTKTQTTFTTARDSHASVAYGGYLYIIGGWNDPTVYGDIQYCPINANGTVGACGASGGTLATARYNHTAVANNGYLYVVHGLDSGGTNLNNVERFTIHSSLHTLSNRTVQDTLTLTARNNHASVSYNGRLYIVGGITNGVYHDDIEYCSYNTGTGALQNCDQQLTAFSGARNNLAAEVYNGYLYIVGGFDGTNYRNDITHCPINSDGSIGTCSQQFDGLPMNRRSMTTAVYSGYLYMFGGYRNINIAGGTAEDYNDEMQVCPLLANGDVGICTIRTDALTTPMSSHDTVMYNGNAYVTGGSIGSPAHYDYVQRIGLERAMPTIARYERVVDTGNAGNTLNSFTINGTATCNYTVSYRLAGSDGIFGSATNISNVVAGVAQTLNVANKQYISLSVIMDDMVCGTQTSITSIVVTYVLPAPPNAPTLRSPTNAATGVNVRPDLQLGVTGDTTGNLRYLIDVCSTSNCSSIVRTIDQTASGTGWTNIGVVVDTYVVNHKYQLAALSPNTQYWWRAQAIDPTDANLWSSYSSIFSFTTAAVTAAPTLYLPANVGTGVNVRPEFRVGVAGNNTGNLKYKLDVCSTSNCSSIVRTIDETASETGWVALGDVGGTYQMSHTYLPAALSSSTQYWWRAQAIEPNGANTWSAYSSIYSFTTGVVNAPGQIIINQNTKIYSGSTLKTGN